MGALIGYARCSTVLQDITARTEILTGLGVPAERSYLDKGLTGTNLERPGLDQALAAVRAGDTLVVPKLTGWSGRSRRPRHRRHPRHPRRPPVAGRSIYDSADPMSKMFFNMLAVFAEFEADCSRCTREGMAIPAPAASSRASAPS